MKVVLMLVVAILMGIGFLAKSGKFADNAIEAVPVATGAVRGAVAAANSNNQGGTLSMSAEQMEVAKKAAETGEIMPYATLELKQLLENAHKINDETAKNNEFPCMFHESEYLGYRGEGIVFKNLQANASNDLVRITFVYGDYEGGDKEYGAGLIEFIMKGNQIDDVRFGYGDNAKQIPTSTHSSLKADVQKMADANACITN